MRYGFLSAAKSLCNFASSLTQTHFDAVSSLSDRNILVVYVRCKCLLLLSCQVKKIYDISLTFLPPLNTDGPVLSCTECVCVSLPVQVVSVEAVDCQVP